MESVLRFEVLGETDHLAVEDDVTLAIFTAELVYGRPRVRLEAAYAVQADGRACVVRAAGEAGDVVARIVAGLLATRYGEEGYRVRRLEPADACP